MICFDRSSVRIVALVLGLASLYVGTGYAEWLEIVSEPNLVQPIKELASFQGDVVVGTHAGETAIWDGASWTLLPLVEDYGIGEVHAICEYNGELWIGGRFTIAGGTAGFADTAVFRNGIWEIPASGIHQYNTCEVNDYCVVGEELFVGGYFGLSGFSSPQGMAKLNDDSWVGLVDDSQLLDWKVYCLEEYESGFYFAGQGGKIGRWADGGIEFLPNLPGDVFTLSIFQDVLYAGGSNFILKRFNGIGWESAGLNEIVGRAVLSSAVYNNSLYACGDFETSDGLVRMARLENEQWHMIEPITFGSINELMVYNEKLYAGGAVSGSPWLGCWFTEPVVSTDRKSLGSIRSLFR